MTRPPVKLFAIVKNTLSHPELGHTTAHVFGAIFELDENGMATDFTPIDFDGKTIRRWRDRSSKEGKHYVGAEQALFFPITDETATLLREAVEEVGDKIRRHENPFYFGGIPVEIDPKLEREHRVPVRFDGGMIPTSHVERAQYKRLSSAHPRAATNCMDFLLNTLEKIGGVPLDALSLEGKTMPRDGNTYVMQKFLTELAGEKDKYWNKRTGGRMINMGEGRYAFAYDCNTGSITAALNRLPQHRTADGREMTVAQFLTQESAPFYDPKLNDVNLTQGTVAQGHTR